MRPGYAVHHILAILGADLALIGHGNGQAHGLQGQADIVAVHIGQAGAGNPLHFSMDAAWEDIQLPPQLLALLRSQGVHNEAGLICLAVEVGFHEITQIEGQVFDAG